MKPIHWEFVLVLAVIAVLLASCDSKSEREREAGQRTVQAKTVVANDGSIRLSAQEVQGNGIQTVPAVQETVSPTITFTGRFRAVPGRESEVTSPFAGRLVSTGAPLPQVGTMVQKGQVVAEVEQLLTASERVQFGSQITQFESAAAQAQQEVNLRRTELDRAKQLYDGGAIPLKQYQTAEFNLEQAQSRLKAAQETKQQYQSLIGQGASGPRHIQIHAPISGVVLTADLTPGMQIDPSKSLMTIVDLSAMWVDAAVHETQLPAARTAQQADVTTPANPGRVYIGKLVTIGSAVDPTNRTVPVVYVVTNADRSLRVEMTAEVHIPSGPKAPAVLAPASAILYTAGQSIVFVESTPGTYQRRVVTTGDRRGQNVIIHSGVQAGEQVVSIGAEALRSETLRSQISTEGDKR